MDCTISRVNSRGMYWTVDTRKARSVKIALQNFINANKSIQSKGYGVFVYVKPFKECKSNYAIAVDGLSRVKYICREGIYG